MHVIFTQVPYLQRKFNIINGDGTIMCQSANLHAIQATVSSTSQYKQQIAKSAN